MPILTDTPVKAYAFCTDARCDGYTQQEVDAIKVETAFTFGENGGDGVFVNFVERSTIAHRFVNDDDVPCPACGHPREVTGDPRPSYQPISGHDPLGLVGGPRFNPAVVSTEQDAAMAEMEAKLRRMETMLEQAMGGEPPEAA